MKESIYNELALMAEYNFTYGGAQRMLSILSKKLNKPIYVNTKDKNILPVWDILPIKG